MKAKNTAVMSNEINKISTRTLTATQEKILMAAISLVNGENDNVVEIPYRNFCELAGINPKNLENAKKTISITGSKMNSLTTTVETDEAYGFMSLFPSFTINKNTLNVRIRVNPDAVFLFNSLKEQFLKVELDEYREFDSSYSMVAYRHFKQFETQGVWAITVNEFMRVMGVPESYKRVADLTKRVLNPIQKELEPIFGKIKIEKKYTKIDGKPGRPPLSHLIFHFKPIERESKNNSKIWTEPWFLSMSPDQQNSYRKELERRKLEKRLDMAEKLGVLFVAGANEVEVEMAMQCLNDGNIDGYGSILDIVRQRTGKTGRKKEKNTPPPADAHYSDEVIADNLPF